jgi:dimeric dUTPase (all-alpha-NTP-PPase superfamily)
MQLERLFDMQKALDQHIEEKHGLEAQDLFNRKILALLVEISELANETRCFKFWSVKPSSEKRIILEEYVDGIHFILSLGIECGFNEETFSINSHPAETNVTEQFLLINEKVSHFQKSKTISDYISLFEMYLQLGELLGITYSEMEQAYFRKNEVNYQRQQNNY